VAQPSELAPKAALPIPATASRPMRVSNLGVFAGDAHLPMGPSDEYRDFFRQIYLAGEAPWDTGRPSPELIRTVGAGLLPGKTALEFGCGTGTNAVELARRGYRVTAVDLADVAVDRGREKARQAGVMIDFRVGDLTRMDLNGPFDVLFDSGVYHGLRGRDLDGFLKTLRRTSRPGTRWLCLAGNAREPHPQGPPVVREEDFRRELGPLFEFLEVREFRFDIRREFQPLAWSILMERR
jgi:SAM-dependent methyltransferase